MTYLFIFSRKIKKSEGFEIIRENNFNVNEINLKNFMREYYKRLYYR